MLSPTLFQSKKREHYPSTHGGINIFSKTLGKDIIQNSSLNRINRTVLGDVGNNGKVEKYYVAPTVPLPTIPAQGIKTCL